MAPDPTKPDAAVLAAMHNAHIERDAARAAGAQGGDDE